MFMALRKEEFGEPLTKAVESMETVVTTVVLSKAKSTIRRKLTQMGFDLKDWDILEIKRKKGVAIEQ